MLNEVEKNEIMKFIQNPAMVSAVRKVFDDVISKNELNKMGNSVFLSQIDNNKLGQIVRAQREAVGFINSSFERMGELSMVKKASEVVTNPAR